MGNYIPCQNCHKEYHSVWRWYICDKCGFRICPSYLNTHKGKYGSGFKCSQCASGYIKQK